MKKSLVLVIGAVSISHYSYSQTDSSKTAADSAWRQRPPATENRINQDSINRERKIPQNAGTTTGKVPDPAVIQHQEKAEQIRKTKTTETPNLQR